MKKFCIMFLSICLVLSMVAMPITSYAATSKKQASFQCVEITDKNCKKFDVTGDNKADKIQVRWLSGDIYLGNELSKTKSDKSGNSTTDIDPDDEDYDDDYGEVLINGVSCLELDINEISSLFYIKLENGKPFIFELCDSGYDFEPVYAKLYEYTNDKLVEIYTFPNDIIYKPSVKNNSIILSGKSFLIDKLGCVSTNLQFDYKKGKFVENSTIPINGVLCKDNKYKTTLTTKNKIGVYKKYTDKKIALTIPINQKVSLKCLKNINGKYYCKIKYNKKYYWIKTNSLKKDLFKEADDASTYWSFG